MGVRRGAGLAATAALLLALGACSEPEAIRQPPSPVIEKSPEPSSATTSPTVPVADPAHAVDAPGKRDGRLWSADILVQWDKPLDDALVKKISRLKGVAHTERIGLGQVSLENRVLTIAAVDPGAYRNFTRPRSPTSRRPGTGSRAVSWPSTERWPGGCRTRTG